MVVCCGIPVLAGVGAGSWRIAATGLVVAIVGVAVNQRRRDQNRAPQEPGSVEACCTTAAPVELAADQTLEHR